MLTEGLIKLPPVWEETVYRHVIDSMIGWAMKFNTPMTKEAVRLAQKKYGGGQKPIEDALSARWVSCPKHLGRTPRLDRIMVVVYFAPKLNGGTTTSGYYHHAKARIVVAPLIKSFFLRRWPDRGHADDLVIAIEEATATVRHEMMHAVQEIYLPAEQYKKNSDYNDNTVGYMTSTVEFDPMIVSSVAEFMKWSRIVGFSEKNLKAFLGMGHSYQMEPNDFYVTLRDHAPTKYKLAVKKFITELSGHKDELTDLKRK